VTAWAGILLASLLGLALYGTVALSERVLVRWAPREGAS
jgi:ABC-type nitrate/sulfonate/bicarbonate transport system permease component